MDRKVEIGHGNAKALRQTASGLPSGQDTRLVTERFAYHVSTRQRTRQQPLIQSGLPEPGSRIQSQLPLVRDEKPMLSGLKLF
jgi:hypothetical protein